MRVVFHTRGFGSGPRNAGKTGIFFQHKIIMEQQGKLY